MFYVYRNVADIVSDRPRMRLAYDFSNRRLYRGSTRRRITRGDAAYWAAVVVFLTIDVALIIYLLCASGLIWWLI